MTRAKKHIFLILFHPFYLEGVGHPFDVVSYLTCVGQEKLRSTKKFIYFMTSLAFRHHLLMEVYGILRPLVRKMLLSS